MTQRSFDVYNEKDLEDLFDIFPDTINKVTVMEINDGYSLSAYRWIANDGTFIDPHLFKINWRDKTIIHRPLKEANGNDCGKLCYMWQDKEHSSFGILKNIIYDNGVKKYIRSDGTPYYHCRRLTEEEKGKLL